jgi:F-type H+-transporting ATPase subunit gamma
VSDTKSGLRQKIDSADDLQSVVRTMKALAASSIGQYEKAVAALADYTRTVELGLSVCFRQDPSPITNASPSARGAAREITAVVFGSDQGLVGQFNDVIAELAIRTLASLPGQPIVWAVGDRVQTLLTDAGLPLAGVFAVPNSVQGIAASIGQILLQSGAHQGHDGSAELHLFYNRPTTGAAYEPFTQRLLPLDERWRRELARRAWPTPTLPEVIGDSVGHRASNRVSTLRALIGEYLFISLFRACAESLASENASRLAAMERADKNIDELLEALRSGFHRLRQSGIDEELFDVVAGYESMSDRPAVDLHQAP